MQASDSQSASSATIRVQSARTRVATPKLSRLACFWLALIVFVGASLLAFFQPLSPNPHQPAGFPSLGWLFYPGEQNAVYRMPKIGCDLNAVYALPNTNKVWAVGNLGLIAHSADGGQTWITQKITAAGAQQPAPTAAEIPQRKAAFGHTTASIRFPRFFPIAHAAETSTAHQDSSKTQRPPQTSAPPTANVNADAALGAQSQPRNDGRKQYTSRPNGKKPLFYPPTGLSESPTTAPNVAVNKNTNRSRAPRQNSNRNSSATRSTPARNRNTASSNVSLQTDTANATPTPVPDSPVPSTDERLIAVYFADDKRGWVLGERGTISSTIDGGAVWSPERGGQLPRRSASSNAAQTDDQASQAPYGAAHLRPPSDASSWVVDNFGILHKYGNVLEELDPSGSSFRENNVSAKPNQLNNVAGVQFVETSGWAVSAKGEIWTTADGGENWRLTATLMRELRGVHFVNMRRGWVVGAGGAILTSNDGGKTFSPQQSGASSRLNAVSFLPGGERGWAVGDGGAILHTADGGNTWIPQSRQPSPIVFGDPVRFPPPWYYFSLVLVGLLLLPLKNPPAPTQPAEETIADVLISDRPLELGEPDPLRFTSIALGLSRFLRNEKTLPPLTIAINGEWGTGKSSLMNLLRSDLVRYGFRPVWFNAWHHQKEEHLLASMLQNIRLQAVPKWWRPGILKFRLRLLAFRGWRQWLPAVLFLLLLSFLIGFLVRHGSLDKLPSLIANMTNEVFSFNLNDYQRKVSEKGVVSALLIYGVALGIALLKGITAFKVNPASLMASMSRGVRMRDLEAQSSFRQKFAVEFADVTRALGSRSMLIFIDDLDRCRPENVLEILEAVNFLVSSGDCFIVMGMARDRVERSVGLSFKDVAEEMLDEEDDAAGGGVQTAERTDSQQESKDKRRRRKEFARQYLDKLINIEVPVPMPSAAQFGELLSPESHARQSASRDSRYSRFLVESVGVARIIMPVLLLGSLLGIGFYVGRVISDEQPPSSSTALRTTREGGAAVTGGIIENTGTPQPPTSGTQQTELPLATPDGVSEMTTTNRDSQTADARIVEVQRAVIEPPAPVTSSLTYWFIAAAMLLFVMSVGVWAAARRMDVVVKDSANFKNALRVWSELIYAKQRTPRSIKRFMNRVRYLADASTLATDY